ncbi:MAG TPA: hypothetical protein VF702_06215 [Allosphingosinicella sp.]|jgi:uncharacterized protein involved in exopolysaccharide biosynthesis
MADDPSNQSDAPAGAGEQAPAASEAAQAAAAAKASHPNRTRNIVAGAAIGIGSAALVAALLYARSSKKGERRDD